MLRAALAFGVAGTVAANGAYGAHWGISGGLLATWSPVALFIAVEGGLFAFKLSAELIAEASKPKRGRPAGSKTGPQPKAPTPPSAEVAIPVLRGVVTPTGSFDALHEVA
jgi:hypothetical protein